jgi:hypothetical protein
MIAGGKGCFRQLSFSGLGHVPALALMGATSESRDPGLNVRDDTQITCTVCRLYAQVACSGSRFSLMWARPPAARS